MNIYIKQEIDRRIWMDLESKGDDYVTFFKVIITSQLMGITYLPYQLGLDEKSYYGLLHDLNDDTLISLDDKWHSHPYALHVERSDTLIDLFSLRDNERSELINLLLKNRNKSVPYSDLAATIVATACLSSGHLFKTLGFKERSYLTTWMSLNFPALSEENTNMRWKRFLYLQLCKQDGDYVCRAPSCGECSSFSECFLPG